MWQIFADVAVMLSLRQMSNRCRAGSQFSTEMRPLFGLAGSSAIECQGPRAVAPAAWSGHRTARARWTYRRRILSNTVMSGGGDSPGKLTRWESVFDEKGGMQMSTGN
jgi:hypothetical protein